MPRQPVNPETLPPVALELRHWRARLGFSEVAMAAYLGIPRHTLLKWENGTRTPDAAPRRLFDVLRLIETIAPEMHARLVADIAAMPEPVKGKPGRKPGAVDSKPAKARKAPAAPVAPAAPENAASVPADPAPGLSLAAPTLQAPAPWISAADAVPAWMNQGNPAL